MDLTFEDHAVEVVALGRRILGEVCAVVEDSRWEADRGVELRVQLRLIKNHTHREPSVRNLNNHKTGQQIIRRKLTNNSVKVFTDRS